MVGLGMCASIWRDTIKGVTTKISPGSHEPGLTLIEFADAVLLPRARAAGGHRATAGTAAAATASAAAPTGSAAARSAAAAAAGAHAGAAAGGASASARTASTTAA